SLGECLRILATPVQHDEEGNSVPSSQPGWNVKGVAQGLSVGHARVRIVSAGSESAPDPTHSPQGRRASRQPVTSAPGPQIERITHLANVFRLPLRRCVATRRTDILPGRNRIRLYALPMRS